MPARSGTVPLRASAVWTIVDPPVRSSDQGLEAVSAVLRHLDTRRTFSNDWIVDDRWFGIDVPVFVRIAVVVILVGLMSWAVDEIRPTD